MTEQSEHIMQKTIQNAIPCTGIGLHSGKAIQMTLYPAAVNTGIVFRRTDVVDKNNTLPAKWNCVVDTRLNTCLGNSEGVILSTVEHFMGALAGLGITNLVAEVNGPEMPIMDGSANDFITLLECAGVQVQNEPVKALKILKKVVFDDNKGATTSLEPADNGLTLNFEIDFPQSKAIGHETVSVVLNEENFKQLVAPARTFGFAKEVEQLRSMGLAQGASLENAVAVEGDSVLNPEGLRLKNEFVAHKVLDAVGDLYQAGMPIIGTFTGIKSGHFHNNQLLRLIFADSSAYEIVEL